MRERSSLINLFWTLLAILAVGATIFGGYVAWRLIHSTTPKIERATVDPEEMLERTVSSRQEEIAMNATEITPESSANVQTNPSVSTKTDAKNGETASSRNEDSDPFWEDYEEYDEEETEENFEDEGFNREFSYTLEDVSTPTKSPQPTQKAKAPSMQSSKIIYASYGQGLLQCKKSTKFPCSWKDDKGPLVKQYWLRSPQGPVERIIYTHDGKIVSQTFSRLDGIVTRYQGNFAELYFENDSLVKIRTFPYDNPNLRDWFLIDKKGKISACLCGIPTENCCARSVLYREGGPRRYCDLFPKDTDFCSK